MWGKLQTENKALKSDLEMMDTDLKRIQTERDHLILASREQHRAGEQVRRLNEEVGRLREADKQKEAELEECRQLFAAKLEEFSTAFQSIDLRFQALQASEQAALLARDQALQELLQLKSPSN